MGMRSIARVGAVAGIAGIVLCLSGCAPRALRSAPLQKDGLVFAPDPRDPRVLLYRNPHLSVSDYSAFLIEEPVLSDGAVRRKVRPEQRAELLRAFRQDLVDELSRRYAVVDAPGPGVLRVTTRILDIEPSRVETDEDRFLVLKFDTPLSQASIELDCRDSQSSELVASLIHPLSMRRFSNADQATRLLTMKDAFRTWTRSLRRRLDEAKARPASAPPQGVEPENTETDDADRRFEEGQ